MDSKRIDEQYKDNPEFQKFQQEMYGLAQDFMDKEMENVSWQRLSIEQQAIQVAVVIFDMLKEGKEKRDIVIELMRFRSVKYAPEVFDVLVGMHEKGRF